MLVTTRWWRSAALLQQTLPVAPAGDLVARQPRLPLQGALKQATALLAKYKDDQQGRILSAMALLGCGREEAAEEVQALAQRSSAAAP